VLTTFWAGGTLQWLNTPGRFYAWPISRLAGMEIYTENRVRAEMLEIVHGWEK